ncbi:phytanoyl-CoA dioxygenase family protein [Paenibacillus kobensis]|uniref:phytanoyl-CoA dioxygenase family protein n=1 Tax=Paenibacillus kobensis TaxID=59841 RepID=UPI001FE8DDF9|nr:phytanoyl-CoA dioxygenase family protein [Paenibacillus kobensis]
MNRLLSKEQLDLFIEKGYVHIREAFSREDALDAQSYLWGKLEKKIGLSRTDRSTWKEDIVILKEFYRNESFDRCNTRRFADAIDDLVGADRVRQRSVYGETDDFPGWGWWPVNFSVGNNSSWTVPRDGWHWDGLNFRYYIDTPEQGLVCLCLFSDIGLRGGSTLLVEGSHQLVAKYLALHPGGVEISEGIRNFLLQHAYFAELTGLADDNRNAEERIDYYMNTIHKIEDTQLRVVESPGNAGDVILLHPFLIHAASPNHSGIPRFMCNRTSALKSNLKLDRINLHEESPLERSIRIALNTDGR